MRTAPPLASIPLPALALALALAGCADGGKEDRVQSQVKIAATNHLFGLVGSTRFAAFPVTAAEVQTLGARIALMDDATFEIRTDDKGSLVLRDQYALSKTGEFSLLQHRNNGPTYVYRGGWDLVGNSQNQFFTDRISPNVGIYVGTELHGSTPGPKGEPYLQQLATASPRWHVFTMSVLFAAANASPSKLNVGHAYAGRLDLTWDQAASKLTIAGRGRDARVQSGLRELRGSVFDLGGTSPLQIDLDYTAFNRTYIGGGSDEIVFGLDRDSATGAVGMLAMVRERATEPRIAAIKGKYLIGLWTVFLNPAASGLDAGHGVLELTADSRFRLQAKDHEGQTFSYAGSIDLPPKSADDPWGAIVFDVENSAGQVVETWRAAVDEDDTTIVLLDPEIESRANNQSEFNFAVGVRLIENPQ